MSFHPLGFIHLKKIKFNENHLKTNHHYKQQNYDFVQNNFPKSFIWTIIVFANYP